MTAFGPQDKPVRQDSHSKSQKLTLRDVKLFARGHAASKRQKQDLNSGLSCSCHAALQSFSVQLPETDLLLAPGLLEELI